MKVVYRVIYTLDIDTKKVVVYALFEMTRPKRHGKATRSYHDFTHGVVEYEQLKLSNHIELVHKRHINDLVQTELEGYSPITTRV